MDDIAQCDGPGCYRLLVRQHVGRPAHYCCPRCRKAAQRERDRQAGVERKRAAQLAEAQAAATKAWRHLQEDIDLAGDLAGAVADLAAGNDRHNLVTMCARYGALADRIEAVALEYFDENARAVLLVALDIRLAASV